MGAVKKPIIIGIAGRSCAGKSTIAQLISKMYPSITYINQDNFFKKKVDKRFRFRENWEEPHAVMFDELISVIKKLKHGKTAYIPTERRTEVFNKKVLPKKIIIVEGFLLFTKPELTKLFDKKIFVDVSDSRMFFRRMSRGWTVKRLHYAINLAIPLSKKYESMQKDEADLILDGNRPIEESARVIKNLLRDLL